MSFAPLYDVQELLQGMADNDQTAFPKLYHQYMPTVYKYAMRFVQQAHQAEEIVQEVFTKIWQYKERISVIDHFEAYLYTMTRNTCFKHLRALANEEKSRTEWVNRFGFQVGTASDQAASRDLATQLQRFIGELPPRQSLAYSMHIQGFKNEEIAQHLSISKNTVKAHLATAVKAVRSHFEALKNVLIPLMLSLISGWLK